MGMWSALPRSIWRAVTLRGRLEVRDSSRLGFLGGIGRAVALDVLDQPVHLVDFPPLRLADRNGQLAYANVG